MSTPVLSDLSAIEAAVEKVVEQEFFVWLDYDIVEDSGSGWEVVREGDEVAITVRTQVGWEDDVADVQEVWRFPLTKDPETIAREVLGRMLEVYVATIKAYDCGGDIKAILKRWRDHREVQNDEAPWGLCVVSIARGSGYPADALDLSHGEEGLH